MSLLYLGQKKDDLKSSLQLSRTLDTKYYFCAFIHFLLFLNDLVSLKNEEQNSTVAQFSISRLDVQAKMLASIYTLLKSKDLTLAADAFSKETNVRHNSSPWLSPLAL